MLSAFYVCWINSNALQTNSDHRSKPNGPWSDCSLGSSLIWVHLACNIGFKVYKHITEQMTIFVNGEKKIKWMKLTIQQGMEYILFVDQGSSSRDYIPPELASSSYQGKLFLGDNLCTPWPEQGRRYQLRKLRYWLPLHPGTCSQPHTQYTLSGFPENRYLAHMGSHFRLWKRKACNKILENIVWWKFLNRWYFQIINSYNP